MRHRNNTIIIVSILSNSG